MALTPCTDLTAAAWLTAGEQPWEPLVAFGPSGFPAYGRLRFLPDPEHEGQSENDVDLHGDAPSESEQLRAALQTLARHTDAPDDCYFCLWDGWGWTVEGSDGAWTLDRHTDTGPRGVVRTSAPPAWSTPAVQDRSAEPAQPPAAPKVVVPNRAYFLFHGAVSDFGDWGAGGRWPGHTLPDPAFVWPADHAWCLTKDVDPHWAGIGADPAALDELLADPRLDVVRADPAEDPPRYR